VRGIGPLSPHAADVLVRIPRTGATNLLVRHPQRGAREYGLPSDAELNGLRELERKNLIAFDHPMDAFLMRLKAAGRYLEQDPRSRPWDRVWIELPNAASEFGPMLERESYRLTAAGRKAAEAIGNATSTQLANSH